MIVPTKLTLESGNNTNVFNNRQIMITGGAEKISNLQAMPFQRPSQQTNSVCKNELNVTNKPDTVHTSNGDPTITILETRDSDMNGKNNRNGIRILALSVV